MNRFLPLAAAVAIFATSGFAEERQSPATPQSAATPEPPKPTRFDLDFPGGTPLELVEAIKQVTGTPLNVIIPESAAEVRVMPFTVTGVTVRDLFQSISSASGGSFVILTLQAEMEGSMWWVSAPMVAEPKPVCRYFQLAPYLHVHTIEDITTAIQTGWKMLDVEQAPKLSFHEETKLLIAVGPEYLVNQIPMVLSQLAADETVAVEKVQRLQEEIQEIEVKKEKGWEREVAERKALIEKEGARVRALRALNHEARRVPPPVPAPN